jgi:cobalt-zinc-cadmium efflux system membrane fusion protein
MKLGEPEGQIGQRSGRTVLRSGIVLVLLLLAAGLGTGAYRMIGFPLGGPSRAQPTTERTPQITREGGRITVPAGSPLRSKLTIEAAGEREIQRTLMLPAVVEADPGRLVKVLPPLAGRITQLKAQLGERVDVGQPLVVLDSPDLATAQADHARAKALLALALKNRDRQRDLTKIGGGALKDQLQAEADYLTAEVEHQRTDARLRQIGVDPDTPNNSRTVTITAPIAGSVIDLAAAPGAFWNDLTAALMTVADLNTVWVTANVPEKDTSSVTKGQAVEVVFSAYQNEIFKGQVLFVSDVLDADTRRTKVRIAFQNPDIRFKPNMFANVSFFTPTQTMLVIPTMALILKDDLDQVFVEVAPWVFEARPVKTSFQQGDQSIVTSGLKVGERIVVKGGVLLND